MTINKNLEGKTLNVALEGRLDTTTAPQLEEALADLAEVDALNLDFAQLEYVSSAGLRVLLAAQKNISGHGKMVIKNVNESIMEVFDITGFSDILTIE